MKKVMKNVLVSSLVSIIVFFVFGTAFDIFHKKEAAVMDISEEYEIVAGVIRNNGDGWELIIDDTHEPISIKNVKQDNEKIIIEYNEYSMVNALTVSVDETMASEGYTVGASVGTSETFIDIYDNERNLVNPEDYVNSSGNIWIQGVFKRQLMQTAW